MKRYLIYLIIIFCIFINYKKINTHSSFNKRKTNEIHRNKIDKYVINKININNIPNLFERLSQADYKFMPKRIYKNDGSIEYRYLKINPNNLDLDIQEIENRIKNFNFLFSQEKQEIIKLLKNLNEIGVLVVLGDIKNRQGSSGYWNPREKTIVLNKSILEKGTYIFHDILAHEAIHVAQSCAAGSLSSMPKRIGLPLDFSINMNETLSHKIYNHNSQEGLYVEQEAYSHSKEIGTAFNLLTQLCQK